MLYADIQDYQMQQEMYLKGWQSDLAYLCQRSDSARMGKRLQLGLAHLGCYLHRPNHPAHGPFYHTVQYSF